LRERERDSTSQRAQVGGGTEKKGEADSPLSRESDVGLDLRTVRP